MRKNFIMLALALAGAIACLSSCSRTEELLATVPASSQIVVAVNFEELANASGFAIHDSTVIIPENIRLSPPAKSQIMKIVPALRTGADISDVVVASINNNRTVFATFLLKDQKVLRRSMRDAGAVAQGNKEGYDCYAVGNDLFIYLGDGQGWAVFGSSNPTPKDIIEETKEGTFKKEYPALAEYLSGNKMISVVATGRGMNVAADQWMCVDVQPKDNDLVIGTRRMDSEGNVLANSSLQNLDPAVLKLLPANAPIVIAAGLTKDIDWNSIAMIGGIVGGFQVGGMLESVVPYLSKTDGTIEFAVVPMSENAWSNPSLSDWNFVFAAQMSQSDAEAAVNAARNYLGTMFTISSQTGDFVAGQGDFSFKVSSANGVFSVVKGNVQQGADMEAYAGDRMLVKAVIPALFVLRNNNISVVSVTGESETTTTISIPGSTLPLLQTVLGDIFR